MNPFERSFFPPTPEAKTPETPKKTGAEILNLQELAQRNREKLLKGNPEKVKKARIETFTGKEDFKNKGLEKPAEQYEKRVGGMSGGI